MQTPIKQFLILSLLIFTVVIAGCSKDDDPQTNNNNNNNPPVTADTTNLMSFTYTAADGTATSFEDIATTGDYNAANRIVVTGIAADGTEVKLSIETPEGTTGTHNVNFTNAAVSAIFKNEVGATHIGSSGSITISAWDTSAKTVSGTFDFAAQQSLSGVLATLGGGTFTKVEY